MESFEILDVASNDYKKLNHSQDHEINLDKL